MPGLFGLIGRNKEENLAHEIQNLLTHNEDWFDGINYKHSLGFHGLTDFKLSLKTNFHSNNGISIV